MEYCHAHIISGNGYSAEPVCIVIHDRQARERTTLPLSAMATVTSSCVVTAASSSRSQVQTRTASTAASLAWDRPSVGVRWRPPLAVAVVTHFVTRPFAGRS